MDNSCCICGLVLAPIDKDVPQWCKDIAAVCYVEGRPTLSGKGYLDDDAWSFYLPIPSHGFQEFSFRNDPTDLKRSCFPFHNACLSLLREMDHTNIMDNDAQTLFDIFTSIHFERRTHALRWGHNYYFEDFSDLWSEKDGEWFSEGIIYISKAKRALLADPLSINLVTKKVLKHEHLWLDSISSELCMHRNRLITDSTPIGNGLDYSLVSTDTLAILFFLPEICELIICHLDFCDALNLLHASAALYRFYGRDFRNLPPLFWESRFWPHGEAAFAQSIRLPSYSWKDWFLMIKYHLRVGSNGMGLRNRKRIWKLAADLINLVCAVGHPDRTLCGKTVISERDMMRGYSANCLAQRYDPEGCRELTQRFERFGHGSQLCAISPSYVFLAKRRLISGLSFEFSDGRSVDVGYIMSRPRNHISLTVSPKVLWFIFSQLGLEEVAVDSFPEKFLDSSISTHRAKFAIAKWTLENSKGIFLGLDAIRIGRVSIDIQKQDDLDGILWTQPYPLSNTLIHKDDIVALSRLQSESFVPASIHCLDPEQGNLIAIRIYSPLGIASGIAGIGFVYNTGVEHIWGSSDNVASLGFFLDKAERLVKITVYKLGSLVCHLQFTTSFHRTSNLLPQLQGNPNVPLECIEYEISGDDITGFCGCFLNPSKLHCFGIVSTTARVLSKTVPKSFICTSSVEYRDRQVPVGQIQNHGSHRSSILFGKAYLSVQGFVLPVASKYRRAGQVTGLLLRSRDDPNHPDLLGQWTRTNTTYVLEEDEYIMDLEFTKARSLSSIMQGARPTLWQVSSITVITNRRRFKWGATGSHTTGIHGQGFIYKSRSGKCIKEAQWEFNAVFDRVMCTYL